MPDEAPILADEGGATLRYARIRFCRSSGSSLGESAVESARSSAKRADVRAATARAMRYLRTEPPAFSAERRGSARGALAGG
jgi:hypothetical protein